MQTTLCPPTSSLHNLLLLMVLHPVVEVAIFRATKAASRVTMVHYVAYASKAITVDVTIASYVQICAIATWHPSLRIQASSSGAFSWYS